MNAMTRPVPFDTDHLDRLMDAAGLDVLLVSSKHNIQYMLGGYQAFFYGHHDAGGISRYLPILIYPKGAPHNAVYIGASMEGHQLHWEPLWLPTVQTDSAGTIGAAGAITKAIQHLRRLGLLGSRIGVELAFLPADAALALIAASAPERVGDALFVLERLRARKTAAEIDMLREASERVVASMLATVATTHPGMTKHDFAQALRREETELDLVFEYCLVTAGTGFNRAPSKQVLKVGDVMSIDSGGNYYGYIGDLARMAILGEPDAELEDLLAEIEAIQQATIGLVKPGLIGGDIYVRADAELAVTPNREHLEFLAHGMGLIPHEAPRLTDTGPLPYPAEDAGRPLESGMALSIETTMKHPRRGFIKLEDTVIVTDDGFEILGNSARGWNQPAAQRSTQS
jgi:Xaa-Pro aminopeptidase